MSILVGGLLSIAKLCCCCWWFFVKRNWNVLNRPHSYSQLALGYKQKFAGKRVDKATSLL